MNQAHAQQGPHTPWACDPHPALACGLLHLQKFPPRLTLPPQQGPQVLLLSIKRCLLWVLTIFAESLMGLTSFKPLGSSARSVASLLSSAEWSGQRDLLQRVERVGTRYDPRQLFTPSCGDGFSCLCYMLLLLLFEDLLLIWVFLSLVD